MNARFERHPPPIFRDDLNLIDCSNLFPDCPPNLAANEASDLRRKHFPYVHARQLFTAVTTQAPACFADKLEIASQVE